MADNVAVLTGAGMSAESGIKTFRDADGLWEGHDITEVASPEGFAADPLNVLRFYDLRRAQLKTVVPNAGHRALAELEGRFHVDVVTQNVDDLHERAGSRRVLHLHGELTKVRSSGNPGYVKEWEGDLPLGATCPDGHQLRPHIVWFGEMVPAMPKAVDIVSRADLVIIVGTSMQVYPAAGLIDSVQPGRPIYFIDPAPNVDPRDHKGLRILQGTAAERLPILVRELLNNAL